MLFEEWGKYEKAVLLLFLVVFASKVYFAFQSPHLSENSYYELRHVEHIKNNGLPLYEDPLSYDGRQYYFPPLFHYVMAVLSIFLPLTLIAKILPSLLFATLIPIVYALSYRIASHKGYSFLAALFFSFTPISYVFTINHVSPYALALPLFFGAVYALIDMRENLTWLLLLIGALVLTHPSVVLLLIGLIFYMVLVKIEGLKVDDRRIEITIFIMFLVFWALFVLYKESFLAQGLGAIWQNLPEQLLSTAFPSLSVFQVVYFVGMVPLFLGAIGAYGAVFKDTDKNLLLLLGLTGAVFILLWLNFLRLQTGLLYLSVLLSVLSAQGLKARGEYAKKTKFAWGRKVAVFFLLFFFVFTSIAPLYGSAMEEARKTPSEEEIKALQWLKDNTKNDSVVVSPPSKGHLITYFAERKNVMDNNFLMIPEIDQRFRDVRHVFTVRLKYEALNVLTKYGVDYIYFPDSSNLQYSVDDLAYLNDECFERVYENGADIYKVECRLRGEA